MTENQIQTAEMLYLATAIEAIHKCAHQHGLLQDNYDPDHMDALDGMILRLYSRNDQIYKQRKQAADEGCLVHGMARE